MQPWLLTRESGLLAPLHRASLDGMAAQMGAAGVDIGGLAEAPAEETVAAGEEAAEQESRAI